MSQDLVGVFCWFLVWTSGDAKLKISTLGLFVVAYVLGDLVFEICLV